MVTFQECLLMAIESTKYLYILMCLLQAGFLILFISLYEDHNASMTVTSTAKKTARSFRYIVCSLCFASLLTVLLMETENAGTLAAEVIRNSVFVDLAMNLMEFACVKQEKRFGTEINKRGEK